MDVYVVLDGAQIVAISAKMQGAEMRRADYARKLADQLHVQNSRDPGLWDELYQRAYARLHIENHDVQDLDQ